MSVETNEISSDYNLNLDERYYENLSWRGEYSFEIDSHEGFDESPQEGWSIESVMNSIKNCEGQKGKTLEIKSNVVIQPELDDEQENVEQLERKEAIRHTKELKLYRIKLMRRQENGWKKLIEMYKNHTVSYDMSEIDGTEEEVEKQYQSMLNEFKIKKEEALDKIQKLMLSMENIKCLIKTRKNECEILRSDHNELELKTCVGMIHSKTGKLLNFNDVTHIYNVYRNKIDELSKHRLAYIIQKNRCKDVLADIDNLGVDEYLRKYETLDSLNKDYENKIDDKSNEIAKYRNRTVSTIQRVTHIYQKSVALEEDIKLQKNILKELDDNLNNVKTQSNAIKRQREIERRRMLKVRRGMGLAAFPDLHAKYKKDLELEESLTQWLAELKGSALGIQKNDKNKFGNNSFECKDICSFSNTIEAKTEFEKSYKLKTYNDKTVKKEVMFDEYKTWQSFLNNC